MCFALQRNAQKMLLPETRSQKTRTLHFFPPVLRSCSSFHDFEAVANSVKSFPSQLPPGPGGRSRRSRNTPEGCDHTWWNWEGVPGLGCGRPNPAFFPRRKQAANLWLSAPYTAPLGTAGAPPGRSHSSEVTLPEHGHHSMGTQHPWGHWVVSRSPSGAWLKPPFPSGIRCPGHPRILAWLQPAHI